MRFVIVANGLLDPTSIARVAIQPGEVVIAADGGTRHCLAAGITPQVIIGDFDSLSDEELAFLEQTGIQTIRHPARKDYTDLELALEHALSLGADEILVLGALGNRWDQTLANLLLPSAAGFAQTNIRLVDGLQEFMVVRAGKVVKISGDPGDTVSLIPLSGDARGITTRDLEYPLDDGTLSFGSTRGVSNVLLRETATVYLKEGILMCILIHGGE